MCFGPRKGTSEWVSSWMCKRIEKDCPKLQDKTDLKKIKSYYHRITCIKYSLLYKQGSSADAEQQRTDGVSQTKPSSSHLKPTSLPLYTHPSTRNSVLLVTWVLQLQRCAKVKSQSNLWESFKGHIWKGQFWWGLSFSHRDWMRRGMSRVSLDIRGDRVQLEKDTLRVHEESHWPFPLRPESIVWS